MRTFRLWLLVVGLMPGVVAGQGLGRNLLENGRFEHPEGPLYSWLTDYAWTENRNYVDNASRISVIPHEAGRRNVVQLRPPIDIGAKMESILIPFELGQIDLHPCSQPCNAVTHGALCRPPCHFRKSFGWKSRGVGLSVFSRCNRP